jgi:glycosyltransferase involved in cell wall biosynthesis
MNCYIVSIKYAPGLFKEFTTMGKKLEEQGFSVKYLISKEYEWMVENNGFDIIYISSSKNMFGILIETACYYFGMRRKLKNVFKESFPDFTCVYNPHPLNAALLKLAKRIKSDGIRTIYLHEPGKPKNASYGFKGNLFFRIVDFCQKKAVSMTTDVILPSPFAVQRFRQFFPDYSRRIHYAPILLSDSSVKTNQKRKYFTIIGRFNFSKQLDEFIELINYAAGRQNYEFQIVTASNIDSYISKLSHQARQKVHIVRQSRITDKQISTALSQSVAVFCIHSNVTQSGVVPVAFMNSTPVIARSSPGLTQFVKHNINGWVVNDNFSICDLLWAMNSVKENFDRLSKNSRNSYLELFDKKNWGKYYGSLLGCLEHS